MSTIAARVDKRLAETVRKVSRIRGEDISSFIRRALLKELAELSYLDDFERKALGLTSKDTVDDQSKQAVLSKAPPTEAPYTP